MSRFGFDTMLIKMDALKRTLPVEVGNMALRQFVGSFTSESWDGKKWQTPQRRIPGTAAYKYPKKSDLGRRSRATLIGKSGGTKGGSHVHLRTAVNNSLVKTEWSNIEFNVPIPYAQRHNEGLDRMPQRQFIGFSRPLMNRIKQKVDTEMKSIFKNNVKK